VLDIYHLYEGGEVTVILADGLKEFQNDIETWSLTLKLEKCGSEVLSDIRNTEGEPSKEILTRARSFIIGIERWKGMCMKERMGNAEKNDESLIWSSLCGAAESMKDTNDKSALLSIMRLKGFGSSTDDETGLRRAKVATSVLRFLFPREWGVVDWRTAAFISILKKNNKDVDKALVEARNNDRREMKACFDIIDEDGACEFNHQYRDYISEQLPRNADVDMALFGLSLTAWPFKVR